MKMKGFSILIKILAILSGIYGLSICCLDFKSFTYFTILSNIFILVVLFIFLVRDIIELITKRKIKFPDILFILKFIATISITLTFFVFLTILAPTFPSGFILAYLDNGAGNLCLHFITPVLAILDFMLFDDYSLSLKYSFYAIIPPLCYVLFIFIIGKFGFRWGNMVAPYNFLNYEAKTGWFGIDFSIYGPESLGIGVFYMIILLSLLFIGVGRLFISFKNKIHC